jgi:GT2 family glycosyltransferase
MTEKDRNRFCITTITCNNRNTLIPTIESFYQNTQYPYIFKWMILLQGCTSEYVEYVRKWTNTIGKEQLKCKFKLLVSKKNLGLSRGNNILAHRVRNYRYVLHLEDDWLCLPQSVTGVPKSWLITCLDFIDQHPEVSTLFLRKYLDDADKKRYSWTRHCYYYGHQYHDNFNYAQKMVSTKDRAIFYHSSLVESQEKLKFQEIPKFLFTFNPCIRRNSDYYRVGVFPLDEFQDIRKSNITNDVTDSKESKNREEPQMTKWTLTEYTTVPDWGWTEARAMEKIRELITYNVSSGIFGHYEDWIGHL